MTDARTFLPIAGFADARSIDAGRAEADRAAARDRKQFWAREATQIEWLRFPGDVVFIVFGSIPLTIAAVKAWLGVRRQPA